MTGCVLGPGSRSWDSPSIVSLHCSLTLSQLTPRHTTVISDLSCFLFIEFIGTLVLFSDNFPFPRIACPDVALTSAHILPHLFTHSTGTGTDAEIHMYSLRSLGPLLLPSLTHSAFEQLEARNCLIHPGVPAWH